MGVDAEMYVKINYKITDEELKINSYIFGSAYKQYLMLGLDKEIWHRPLEHFKNKYDFIPVPYIENETLLEVPLSGRYYGIGYERGPLMFYIGMAELLEFLFHGCEIWYGGDSSDEKVLFDREYRNQLMQHFTYHTNESYGRFFDKDQDGKNCPVCDVKMIRNGWGMNFKAFYCGGCGWQIREKDGIFIEGFNRE